jgi:hypothetical protein
VGLPVFAARFEESVQNGRHAGSGVAAAPLALSVRGARRDGGG